MSTCSLFKVVLVGNRNVGKTCMVTKYCEGQFIDDQAPTYTANFVIKNIKYKNEDYKLCIWDTSGNHSMVSYLEACCSEANAVILVFDVNDRKSFDDLEFWMPEVYKVCDEQAVKIIVGCKTDLQNENNPDDFEEDAILYAKEKDCTLMFVSNRIGYDVDQVFDQVMENLCKNYIKKSNLSNKLGSFCKIPISTKFQNIFSKINFCVPKKKKSESILTSLDESTSEIIQ